MTGQDRRDETAQPRGAAQSGGSRHRADTSSELSATGGSSGPSEQGDTPSRPFVVRDKRRKPSPRPRTGSARSDSPGNGPATGAGATARTAAGEADVPDNERHTRTGGTHQDTVPDGTTQNAGTDKDTGTRAARAGGQPVAERRADRAAVSDGGPAERGADRQPSPGTDTTSPEGEQLDRGAGRERARGAAGSTPFAAELEALRKDLEERTSDLQRVTAEYANYRRRMDRERARISEQATAGVLGELLGVLDDLDRAREHGDLVGPFGAVADQLVSVLTKVGLSPFGDRGDVFDPVRHEAVTHSVSSEVDEPTCVEVFRRGYAYGERLLRPALVAVAEPGEEPDEQPDDADDRAAPAPAGQVPDHAAGEATGGGDAGAPQVADRSDPPEAGNRTTDAGGEDEHDRAAGAAPEAPTAAPTRRAPRPGPGDVRRTSDDGTAGPRSTGTEPSTSGTGTTPSGPGGGTASPDSGGTARDA